MHPLSRYFPVKDGDEYIVQDIFRPVAEFFEKDFGLAAKTARRDYNLYTLRDIVRWTGKVDGARTNFQGLIGERLLSLVLEELVANIASGYPDGHTVLGSVLKESPKHEGKGFLVAFNNDYALRYMSRTSFVVLKKAPLEDPNGWYEQEKMGLQASEIDGLAYLHVNEDKYLLVGEVKTMSSWDNIKGYGQDLADKVFAPLKSLFSGHSLVYVFMADESLLFRQAKLKQHPKDLIEQLPNIDVMFIPMPKMPRTIDDYANEMESRLPLVRSILDSV